MRMLGMDFSVVTPRRFTSSGNLAVAAATRFWVNTVFMSGSVPTSKETWMVIVPSLALMDFM